MRVCILLIVDVFPYANQAATVKWRYHLMLDWYVPIDYREYAARTALSVINPSAHASMSRHQCHTVSACLLQNEKIAGDTKVLHFKDL
jgi:hypothetical protein